ncbi:MAG: hypothetical protein ACM3YF_02965 [Candidatus Zixiibacteriota bacterium]
MNKKVLLFFALLVAWVASLALAEAENQLPLTGVADTLSFLVEEGMVAPASETPAFNPMLACTANYLRGDFNEDRNRTIEDVAQMISCVFYGSNSNKLCLTCICDMNCDGWVTPVDAYIEMRMYAAGPPTSRTRIVCAEE